MQAATSWQYPFGPVCPQRRIPVPQQDVFKARHQRLMYRDICTLTMTGVPFGVQCRQRGDRRIGAGDHEVEVTKTFEGRCIDIASSRDCATQGARDQIRGKVVGPRSFGPERGRVHNNQFGASLLKGFDIDRIDAKCTRAGQQDVHPVCDGCQFVAALRGREVNAAGPAVGGKVQVPQRGFTRWRILEVRPASAEGVTVWRFYSNHRCAEVGKQFCPVDPPVVRQVEYRNSR